MAAKRHNRILGIALGERSALVAEVAAAAGAGRPRLTRAAEFPFPPGLRLEQAEAVGHALGAFLRAQGFGARSAVFGVPARWLLAKRKQVPPVDAATAAGILRLQAESEFSAEAEELVYDFDGATSDAGPRDVLLLALPRRYAGQVAALAGAARLHAVAMTPCGAALAAALAGPGGDAAAVLLGPGGAELVARHAGQPRVLRYVGAAGAPAAALAAEVRRASVGLPTLPPAAAAPGGGRHAGDLWIWNDAGVDAHAVAALAEALGRPVRGGDFPALGVESVNGTAASGGRGYAAAASLALAGLAGGGAHADFLHSRLIPPRPSGLPRRPVLLALTGLAAILLAAAVVADLRGRQRAAFDLRRQAAQDADAVKAAEAFLARFGYAKGWVGGKPRFITCLREVTAAVPEEGRTYLTSFNLGDDMQGGFTGKSASVDDVLALRNRLRNSGRFRDVRMSFDAPRATAKPAGPGPGAPTPGARPGAPGPASPGSAAPGPAAPGSAGPPGSGAPSGPAPGGAQVAPGSQPTPIGAASAPPTTPSGGAAMPPGATAPGPVAAHGPARAAPGGPAPPVGPQPIAGAGGQPGQGEIAFAVTFHYVPPG